MTARLQTEKRDTLTRASQALIEHLQARIKRFEAHLQTETDPIRRSVSESWLDATRAALLDFELAQPQIESEAFLCPPEEDDFPEHFRAGVAA